MKRFTLLSLALILAGIFSTITVEAANYLFKNGRSAYSIVLSSGASSTERTAAEELQTYVQAVSGARLPIITAPVSKGPAIYVGYQQATAALSGVTAPDAHDEGFTYRSQGADLYIYGGKERGTLYGVYTFLENELGIRWYTPDFTRIPHLKKWELGSLNHSERPTVKFRQNDYFKVANTTPWRAHNKENFGWEPTKSAYGNIVSYWKCHTMPLLVPSAEFYQTHPEYFCLRGGKRQSYGQLCLSNPDVLQLCKERMAETIKNNPGYAIYSLSQDDNQLFCECDACKAIEAKYGGHSGIMIWFVNQVADYIKPLFPDIYIGTFAYQYTRKPPVGIKPNENVVIRLCSIECCFAHPLDAGCPENRAFMEDLKAWSQLAPHLFIWDYVVDYAQYMAPWPNFQVLAPNIRVFRDNHAIGVYEESQYQSAGGEFEEMKAWVLSKLLWNPDQDVEPLVKDFIEGYYGAAAPKVMEYYRLCQSLIKPDLHYGIFINHEHPLYSDEFVTKGLAILRDGVNLATDDDLRERVNKVRMQLLFLKSVRQPAQARSDGTWSEFVNMARKYQARPHELYDIEKFIKDMESK